MLILRKYAVNLLYASYYSTGYCAFYSTYSWVNTHQSFVSIVGVILSSITPRTFYAWSHTMWDTEFGPEVTHLSATLGHRPQYEVSCLPLSDRCLGRLCSRSCPELLFTMGLISGQWDRTMAVLFFYDI